jgi:hypothetical protein
MRSFLVALMNLQSSPHGKLPPRLVEIYCTNLIERGEAHPRVTGCKAIYKIFLELESARKYMTDNGVSEYVSLGTLSTDHAMNAVLT